MILGFSSGCLYKTHDRIGREIFDIFRSPGCNAIELMFHDLADAPRIAEISKDELAGFEHVSLHAPKFDDLSEKELEETLDLIEATHQRIGLDYVVIHPDTVSNWKVFSKYSFPIAVENMDNRKEAYKDVADMEKLFSQVDVKMILDVNHCFSNDPTMKLAYDFIEAFRDRIVGFHLSGFETFHDPLFKTQQQEIMDAVFDKNLPIIIESGCESVEDVEREYEYIKNKLF